VKKIIRSFDGFLSRQEKIFAFAEDPQGFLRGQLSTAESDWVVAGRRIAAGDPILQIHMFNENLPPLPRCGPDLAWALRFQRLMISSFRKLARLLETDPAFAAIQALEGVTVLVQDDAGTINRIFLRLGFSVLPYRNRLGGFGEFWENFYTWWVMWAYNPPSLRGRRFLKMRRSRIVIPREDFLRRYGPGPADPLPGAAAPGRAFPKKPPAAP
jgi:hypothetical protein